MCAAPVRGAVSDARGLHHRRNARHAVRLLGRVDAGAVRGSTRVFDIRLGGARVALASTLLGLASEGLLGQPGGAATVAAESRIRS